MKLPGKRFGILPSVAIFTVLASAGALAQQVQQAAAPATPGMHGQKLDANGDGVIDRSEAAAVPRLAERFDQLDANHDGKLTPDERHQGHQGMRARMQQLDADHDGRISRDEAAADPQLAQAFDQRDANHDGFLDREDFKARFAQKRGECFAKADADGNGQLSRAEYDALPGRCHGRGGMQDGMRGEGTPRPQG